MQPLYTVDHESRHNSTNYNEVERQNPTSSESSPLLQRLPQYTRQRNPATMIIVTFLLVILITGIIIGIYLLVIQSESENVLPPPIEKPLQLVTRSQWDHGNISQSRQIMTPFISNVVMVVQTNTDTCESTESCIKLLQAMQANATAAKSMIPYNFLISSNGQTYEALGWHRSPEATQQPNNGIVLALIGNFSEVPPTLLQMQECKKFFAMAVSQQHLYQSYRIIGKNIHDTPMYLSKSFIKLPQWSNEFADSNK